MKQVKKLRDIAIIAAGQGAPQGDDNYCDNGTPFIKAGNLVELLNGKRESEVQKVSENVAKEYKLKLYPAGTVLFAKSGMSCMKGYVYQLKMPCYVVSHLACITPTEVAGEYLKFYFEYHRPNSLVKDEAYPSISLTDIGSMDISLGTDIEQQEIVTRLNKISDIIRQRRQEIQKLEELVKSQFIEMFENKSYKTIAIGELVEAKIESAKKKFKADDDIRYVDISSIDNKLNEMTGFTLCQFGNAPSRAQQCLREFDIVVSTVRPNLRNIAMNHFQFSNIVASSGFCVLRAKNCNPQYLFVAVLMDEFSRKMSSVTSGANYPAVKDSDILSYEIPCPPIELQNEFARFVEQTDKSKVLILKNKILINRLVRVA